MYTNFHTILSCWIFFSKIPSSAGNFYQIKQCRKHGKNPYTILHNAENIDRISYNLGYMFMLFLTFALLTFRRTAAGGFCAGRSFLFLMRTLYFSWFGEGKMGSSLKSASNISCRTRRSPNTSWKKSSMYKLFDEPWNQILEKFKV